MFFQAKVDSINTGLYTSHALPFQTIFKKKRHFLLFKPLNNKGILPSPLTHPLVKHDVAFQWSRSDSAVGESPDRALASTSRCCCRKRAVRPQACRDSFASRGQQDSRQDRDSDAPSPSGFMPRLSSSRHCGRTPHLKFSSKLHSY